MPSLAELIQQGSTDLWLFLPTAVLLGALHGLEPGHSKTMMAAFIVAVRGTVAQAVLLGLCAALSHSLVVWLLAAIGLHFGSALIAEQAEPWLLLGSGTIVVAIAAWMAWRTRPAHDHDHHEAQDAHERAHAEDIRRRFASGRATTGQIALFGLTGGLMPCPASVTVLMICLNLRQFTLGAAMVASFSLGLAIALVGVGVLAAWGTRHAHRHFGGRLETLARRAPWLSSALMVLAGGVMIVQGLTHLSAG